MPLSESSTYDHRSPNAPPPSMGPGAHPANPQNRPPAPDPTAVLREVTEIRSHYNWNIDRNTSPPVISIGYNIHDRFRKYTIPISNMPLNSATSWLLYGGSGRAMVTGIYVIDTVRGAENMADRPLSQSEVEGLAMHASRRQLYSFAANISAVGIGIGMAFVSRKTMKFPFRRPQPIEKYNNFPNRWMPIIKGQYARAMWHITRANIYTAVGLLLLNPLYSSMGDSAMMVGLYRDSRTNDVMKTIKDRGQRLSRIGSNRGSSKQGGEPSQSLNPEDGQYADPDPEGYYNDTEPGATSDYNGGRDYNSNTAGDTAYTDGTTDTGVMDDSMMQYRESNQSSPAASGVSSAWRRPPQQPQQSTRASSSRKSGDFLDDLDDASPTAGSDPLTPIGAYPDSSSSSSAWDRVRRGSGPSSEGNTTGIVRPGYGQSPGSTAQGMQEHEGQNRRQAEGSSFSYDDAEAERQLAKETAQKEFDDMLDRERRGSRDREVKDSSSGFGRKSAEASDGGDGGGESAWERRRRRG